MSWKQNIIKNDYWKPIVEAETVEGVIIDIHEGNYGKEYIIETKEHERIITPSHKVLQLLLEGNKVSDRVQLIYKGDEPSNKGNPKSLYDVYTWTKE